MEPASSAAATLEPPPATPRDPHFDPPAQVADLGKHTLRGGVVTISAQGVKFLLQMGSTALLARVLTPTDYGLIAMVSAVTGFVMMFKDAGLSMATIQYKRIQHEQVSALFWINVALSAGVMLVVAGLAPALAWFYHEPRLVGITLALAGTFLVGGLTVQHQALLRRQMRFRDLALIDILSLSAGIVTAYAMARARCGYWSLVGMTASTAVANCILVWSLSGWRPSRPAGAAEVGRLLRFGGGMTAFNVLNYLTRNADNVIVGYTSGSGPLGIYSKAYYLLMMPIQQINAPISSVMIPTLSRLQDDPPRFRNAFLKAVGAIAFFGMPAVAFLFVIADEIVGLLLGPSWAEVGRVFRWLAPAALLGTINVAPGWLCTALGRVRVQVRWAMWSAPITVGAFLIGAHWGIVGVAAGFTLSWGVMFVVFLYMACEGSPISFGALVRRVSGPLVAALGAAAVALGAKQFLAPDHLRPPALIPPCGVAFFCAYLGIFLALPGGAVQFRALCADALRSVSAKTKRK